MLQNFDRQTLIVAIDLSVEGLKLIDQILVFRCSIPLLEFPRHRTSSNVNAIVSVELAKLTDQFVDYQLVKSLQKLGAKVFMKEVDEAQAERLLALQIVPVAELV